MFTYSITRFFFVQLWNENHLSFFQDVEHYYEQLPVKIGLYKIDDLAHSDFLWRDRTVKEIYLKILDIFKKYETF